MEEYDFTEHGAGSGTEFERKRRKKKKVRLWLGQPKRFNLMKKGVKDGGKKNLQSTKRSARDRQTVLGDMSTTEEAMAASILLQMSSHVGHVDHAEDSKPVWTKDNKKCYFTRPKGPSWIVDHDYAIQPQKYGNQKADYYKRRSWFSKSKKTTSTAVNGSRESSANLQLPEQVQFSEHKINKSDMQMTWRDNSNPHVALDYEEANNMRYPSDQLDCNLENDTVLHLTDNGEILKLSQHEDPGTCHGDVMLECMKGDVEYKTVVITDDDGNILQNWNESISYRNSENGLITNEFQGTIEAQQLCSRCNHQIGTENSVSLPSTSTTLETVPSQREQYRNAPDVIPMFVDQDKIPESELSEDAHQSVREISNLSTDLVRNLENANMLENFMVLFRTIAAGYVPDLSEIDDLKTMKSGINKLPVGIVTNG